MAKNITRHVQHIKSVDTTTITVDGQDVSVAKLPEWGDLKDGEIAVNYKDGYETISIRNNNNEVVAFPNINTVNTLIEEKAQATLTFDTTPTANSTNPVTSGGIKTYVDNGDKIQALTTYQSSTPLAVGDTHDQALSKLSKIIDDNEIFTARALTDLNDTKQDEIEDLDVIRTGAALGATALQTETQLSKGTTTGSGNAVTDISVDNHQITLTKGATFLTEHQDLSAYADGAEYDSTNHLIYLKHGNNRLSNPINANDFIKDGMVDTVTVTGGNLVITFNTDSGKEDIEISLTDIFDPSLYYTKEEIDEHELVTAAALTELHDTKQELLTFDNVPTSGSSNPVTSSGIKNYVDNTVNSLAISELVEPEASTPLAVGDTYDDAFAKLSKIIRDNELATAGALTELHNTKQELLTFDSTPTADSTNPVTSGGIKTYVDAGDSIQSLTTYQSSTPLAVGDTHDQAFSKLSKIIDDNEIVTARALTDLNDTKQELLTFDSTPTANSQNPVTSEGIKEYVDDAIDASTPMTEITYSDLVTARNNNNLKPGTWYRITDYTTTTTQADTQSAGHQFDIVLLALSENKLAEEGWAMMNDNIYDVTFTDGVTKKCYLYFFDDDSDCNIVLAEDLTKGLNLAIGKEDFIKLDETNKTAEIGWSYYDDEHGDGFITVAEPNVQYNYFQNSNLSAWKVWYCLDNDTTRFAWADDNKAFNISYEGEDYQMVRNTSNDVQGLYAWSNDDIGMLYTNNETPQIGDNLYWQDGTLAEENELTKGIYFTGRGIIYRLIDEFNNDCPYDFKNIQFKRWAITALTNGSTEMKAALIYDANDNPVYFGTMAWGSPTINDATLDNSNTIFAYTFDGALTDAEGNITHYDISANPLRGSQEFVDYMIEREMGENVADRCDNNHVGNYGEMDIEGDNLDSGLTLPNNVFFNKSCCYYSEDDSKWVYSFSMCYGNTLKTDCYGNTFGNGCFSNTFGNGCNSNTFGNECYSNTFGNRCFSNTFGNGCASNTFGNDCARNTFGNNCVGNTFGNYCSSNTFGNNCGGNTFGNSCTYNTFGNGCNSNTFGNNFRNNTFGNSFQNNTFGNGCTDSTFGNNAEKCSVGDGVNNIRVQKDYVNFIIIENGNQYIDITSTQTTSSSNKLRNFEIALGCNNTTTRKTLSHNTVNDNFRTTYQPTNSQVVHV